MKKLLFSLIFVIFISMFLTNVVFSQGIEVKVGNSSYTYQGTVYNLELNGLWVPTVTPCIVISGFAYVPLREVFQDYLGLVVGYDNTTELAYVKDGSKLMEFSFKQQAIYQNGKKINTDLTVALINGNIMVPLSKTTEYFGYTAGVKPDNKTLTIQWNNKSESGTVVKDTEVTGSVKRISYYAESGKEFIFIETSASKIGKQFVLQPMEGNPFYRICLQISETRIEKPGNLDVYAGSIQQVRFAQVENSKQTASIVTEVDHIPEYIVNKVTGGFQIAITSRKSADNTPGQEKAPDPTITPEPTKSPDAEVKPEPTKSPEPEVKPEPTKPIEPEVKPEPTQIPQPPTPASPTPSPATPLPTQAPVVTPSPTVTPKPEQGIGSGAIRYTMDGDNCIILLDNVDLNKKTKENPDLYKIEYRTIEKMLQIRMPLTDNYKTEVIPGNSILHGIISFSNRTRNEVNIRISGRNDLNYLVASNGGSGTKIILNPNKDFAYNPTPTQSDDSPSSTPMPTPQPTVSPVPVPTTQPAQPKESPTPTPQPIVSPSPVPTTQPTQPKESPTPTPQPTVTPTPTHTPQPQPTGTPTPTSPKGSLANRGDGDRSGTLSFVAGTDKIIIETIALYDYKIFRLSNPSRIIIDMPQNLVDSREYNYPSGRIYSKIRTGQYETTTARMVIEAHENTEWDVKKDKNILTVTFSNSGIKNLIYSNNEDNAALKLTSPDILQVLQQNTDKIEIEDDIRSGTFSFIFPGDAIDLGSGKMQIGNKIMKSVHTLTTANKTYLVISRESTEAKYQLFFTESDDEIMIVLSDGSGAPITTPVPTISPSPAPTQPKENSGKLVVLDAGHGGSEPGATYGKGEKWYNLDITLKTAAILKEKGVNIKLTREKDEFVGLYERAEMANDWKADVFISIHNNAFFDKKINGTMTFFYTGSYKGKEYATIIQNDLLKNLGSRDIGVKSQNFVVIRDTKMPAVLVEIGCLSNDAERAKLDTEEYRLKAAQSLAESILKIISQ